MQKLDAFELQNYTGGKSIFTDDQASIVGFACGAGIFISLFATGGLAIPALVVTAAVYGGGVACGVGIGDWLANRR